MRGRARQLGLEHSEHVLRGYQPAIPSSHHSLDGLESARDETIREPAALKYFHRVAAQDTPRLDSVRDRVRVRIRVSAVAYPVAVRLDSVGT